MKIKIIVIAISLTLISTLAFSKGRPICQFNGFGEGGTFRVYFDQRIYDPSSFPPDDYYNLYPNGGIKFGLDIGIYPTKEERDSAVSNIIKVVLKNGGQTFETEIPDKWDYVYRDGSRRYSAEYYVCYGHIANAIGYYELEIQTRRGKFSEQFEITQDMLEYTGPEPVSDVLVEETSDDPPQYKISAKTPTPPSEYCGLGQLCFNYRLRAENAFPFNEEGESALTIDEEDFVLFGPPDHYDNTTNTAEWNVNKNSFQNYTFRIESMLFGVPLPTYNLNICDFEENSFARTILHFRAD